jgi:hypothetical protein
MTQHVTAFIFPHIMEGWDDQELDRRLRTLQDFGVVAIGTEADTYQDRLIEKAHSLGMKFMASISCFSDHGEANKILEKRPELHPILENGERRPLMEWYIGVTPTFDDYAQSRLDLLESILRNHDVDGMWLDFIRWPMHWELELRPGAAEPMQSSFDPHSVARFLEFANLEIPRDAQGIPQQASWILDHHRDKWTDFKCATITRFVAEVKARVDSTRPDAVTGVFLVPAPDDVRAYLVGQRESELAPLVNFLSPMAYHPVLHRTPEWAIGVVDEMVRRSYGRVLPVYQVDSAKDADLGADFGPPVSVEEWRKLACNTAKRDDIAGMTAFTGTALFADNRGQVLAECLAQTKE